MLLDWGTVLTLAVYMSRFTGLQFQSGGMLDRIFYGGETKRLEMKIMGCFRHSFPVNHFHAESLERLKSQNAIQAEMAGTGGQYVGNMLCTHCIQRIMRRKSPRQADEARLHHVSRQPVTSYQCTKNSILVIMPSLNRPISTCGFKKCLYICMQYVAYWFLVS